MYAKIYFVLTCIIYHIGLYTMYIYNYTSITCIYASISDKLYQGLLTFCSANQIFPLPSERSFSSSTFLDIYSSHTPLLTFIPLLADILTFTFTFSLIFPFSLKFPPCSHFPLYVLPSSQGNVLPLSQTLKACTFANAVYMYSYMEHRYVWYPYSQHDLFVGYWRRRRKKTVPLAAELKQMHPPPATVLHFTSNSCNSIPRRSTSSPKLRNWGGGGQIFSVSPRLGEGAERLFGGLLFSLFIRRK